MARDITRNSLASLAGRRVLVVGLGRFGGGVGVTRWLVEQQAQVTVTDQAEASTLTESIAALAGLPVTYRLGGHDFDDLRDTDLVVMNPAVDKSKSTFFAEVVRRNIPWTTEMNLFCERCPAVVVGVTGSFGKSTTCAMLAEVLCKAAEAKLIPYRQAHLGGNIGRSLLPELGNIQADDVVVLEMSNAQLEDLPRIGWAPHWCAITNLFPHHLDRHGTFEAYVNAKLNIVRDASQSGRVVVGEIHPDAEQWLLKAVHGKADRLIHRETITKGLRLRVPGEHNERNAACVLTVCRAMGIPEDFVLDTLQSFSGLPHRLQHVRRVKGVDFYNDSKSTSPSATIVAIDSFQQPLIVILCGQAKDVELRELATLIRKRCKAVVCTGAAGPRFAGAIRNADVDQLLKVVEVDSLEHAVLAGQEYARQGDAVLFSPSAPSFDHYVNYEARGNHFVRIVNELGS